MKKTLWLLLIFCFGCSLKPKAPAGHISLINNHHSIKFSGPDYSIISEINRDTATHIWESMLPVYRMPADTDMKDYQPVQHGTYLLKDSAVVYTPDTPFVKGKTYFMRYYQFKGDNIWDYIKGKKKLGAAHYIDLAVRL